jgi:hypothetical protein
MGWLRDYLWLNSSQLINGYNPFGMQLSFSLRRRQRAMALLLLLLLAAPPLS